MKITAKGKKITEPEITHVSLVKDPANGAPIKILRNTGNNLMKFNLAALSGAAASTPLAIFVAKKSLEKYTPILQEHGFDLSKQEEVDGTIIIKMAPFEEDEVSAVQVADDMAFVVHKFLDPYKSGLKFNEKVKATGFMPTVRGAMEAFMDGMYDAINEADTPEELSNAVSGIGDDLNTYLYNLAKALPKSAFTVMKSLDSDSLSKGLELDAAQAAVDGAPAEGAAEGEGTEAEGTEAEAEGEGEAEANAEGEAEGTEAEGAEGTDGEAEAEAEGEGEAEAEGEAEGEEAEANAEAKKPAKKPAAKKGKKVEPASKSEGEGDSRVDDILKAVTGLTGALEGIAKAQNMIVEKQEALSTRIENVENTTKNLRNATNASADSDADDDSNVVSLQRSAEFGGIPVDADQPMPDSFWSGTGLSQQ